MEGEAEYSIAIDRRSTHVPISAQAIRDGVRAALESQGCREASVGVVLVDDAEIARLNESYLHHSGPTDVLSFDLRDDPTNNRADGEVVVSAETADREAERRDVDARGELILYVIHGTLHLVGWNDASAEEAAAMHETEDRLLESLGYGAVYRSGERP